MRERYRKRGVERYVSRTAALAVCLMFLVFGMTGQAARTGTVTTDGARVRQEASTEASRICSLPVDTTVDVTGETESGGSTWYQVSFTYEGEQMSGWLRSDLLTVTETEDPEASEEEPSEGEGEGQISSAAYTIQEPEEAYSGADSLIQTTVQAGEQSYTAYQPEADTQLYLVWASKADGTLGWYWYDPSEGTFQKDLGQFQAQGLKMALQSELTTLKESSAKKLSQRLYVIIGLGVLSAILLVVITVLAFRNRGGEYEYDDETYDDPDDGDSDDYEEKTEKKKRFFRRKEQEDDEEDDFDDFFAAVSDKSSGKGNRYEKDADEEEEAHDTDGEAWEEKPDLSLTSNLPKIDMSALEEAEEKAAPKKTGTAFETGHEDEDSDSDAGDELDIDIEILDLDDLNL